MSSGSCGFTAPLYASKVKSPVVQASKSSFCDYMEDYKPFMSEGFVSIDDNTAPKPIRILRDTGASQFLLLEGVLPLSENTSVGATVLLQGVELDCFNVPLYRIYLKSDLITGPVIVGVRHNLPFEGVSLLLGNDLAGKKVVAQPIVTNEPAVDSETSEEDAHIYQACVVTRAMEKKEKQTSCEGDPFDLSDTFLTDEAYVGDSTTLSDKANQQYSPWREVNHLSLSGSEPVKEQIQDSDIMLLRQRALPLEDASKEPECYYLKYDILVRKWRPPDALPSEGWRQVHQIVVPKIYRQEIIELAHDTPLAGHLGVRKSCQKVLQHLYWPRLKSDAAQYCRSCHICQVVGKPNQKIPPAPLLPIPAFEEPFSRILIDCVGLLPKKKAIMCTSTRFPEAIPLRNIKTPAIVKALVKFFTVVGLPKSIRSDQGSKFMSRVFQQVGHQLGIQ